MGTTEKGHAGLLVDLPTRAWQPKPFFRNGLFTELDRIGPRWILAIRGQNPPAAALVMAEPTLEEYETGQRIMEEGG